MVEKYRVDVVDFRVTMRIITLHLSLYEPFVQVWDIRTYAQVQKCYLCLPSLFLYKLHQRLTLNFIPMTLQRYTHIHPSAYVYKYKETHFGFNPPQKNKSQPGRWKIAKGQMDPEENVWCNIQKMYGMSIWANFILLVLQHLLFLRPWITCFGYLKQSVCRVS